MPAQMERMTNGEDLCDRLRRLRERRVWTLQELASRSGVHYTTIARAETQREYKPRPGTIRKLADALGVSAEYLRFGTVEPAPGTPNRLHALSIPALWAMLWIIAEFCACNAA
jgi:transcriptional regulator with XRE-family HTH domain